MVKDLIPLFEKIIKNKGNESKMIDYIQAYGIKGVPILIGLSFFQAISFIFPAFPIQILSGLCYGMWIGSLLYIIGASLGNLSMFLVVQKFESSLPFFKERSKKSKIKLLDTKKIKNPERLVILLYLIPIIPNAMLPYFFSKTNITPIKYFISLIISFIPFTLLTTGLGHSISHGNYTIAIVILIVLTIALVIIFLFKNKILNKMTKYY